MQLSARILTALAVLAFVVGVVAGANNANDEVSAATGTIDAMNVGACTTTNADVLSLGDCKIDADGTAGDGNTEAFFEGGPLGEAIEVDELYATYSHDPKTAAEAPRSIIANGDLLKISIKDTGRDRRDPVLIALDNTDPATVPAITTDHDEDGAATSDPSATPPTTAPINVFKDAGDAGDPMFVLDDEYDEASTDKDGGSLKIVADSVGVKPEELSALELQTPHFGVGTAAANFTSSGSYTILFQGSDDDNPFQPIAPKGVVKFFGCVDSTDTTGGCDNGEGNNFKDIGGNVKLDEDVISGESNVAPAMVLNVSVPTGGEVQLQVVYYETSAVENLVGGEMYCTGEGAGGLDTDGDCPGATSDDDMANDEPENVVYTANEKKNNTALLVQAASDGNDADANLFLTETGRFDGVYEGFVRLTDADGDGRGDGDAPMNWGEMVADAGSADANKAAVLGVGSGPVIINYRDSSGQSQSLTIQIDIEPPVISIDSPAHNSRSDDEKPSFIGTINDGDAGLAADTFQLYVDNNPTPGTGEGYMVLSDLKAGGVTTDEDDGLNRRLEYMGYDTDTGSKYGVVPPETWMAEDSATGRGEKQHKSVEADAYANGAPDGEFADEIEIDFDEQAGYTFPDGAFNHKIEFQALVRDLAGNVGFSDSDPAKPRFINDLGTKAGERTVPNVLGVFSQHAVWLDEVDPYIHADRTVTGFYGLNDDKAPIRDRSSVMVVFDNAVNGSLIDVGTFMLEYDDGSEIGIADVLVKDQLVFLKLDEELASDARPTLSITEGREVEDMAGNILGSAEHLLQTDGDRMTSIKVRDGIRPVFTLTLSGGSGTGNGAEGPTMLTREAIDIAIESDEDINGAPKVAVVCSNIKFNEEKSDKDSDLKVDDDKMTVEYGLARYEANRDGYDADTDLEVNLDCGAADAEDGTEFVESSSLSRPGNNWVYAWRKPESDTSKLPDGGITVVVWGRDRSDFQYYNVKPEMTDTRHNFGSETVAFTLDTIFHSPLTPAGGDVQPDPNEDVGEPRPFVLLDFAGERTNVNVTKMTIDGTDVLGSLDNIGENRFLYWPETLEYGEHTIVFDARDAADNKVDGAKFSFDVTARKPFVLDIAAGWNAISFPADPVDSALDSVFTETSIDRVVGWNPMSSTGPWSIASRVDGVWTTSESFAPLTDVTARYGYWVHSSAFVLQNVDLTGPINRETGGSPTPRGIPTIPGWNFVGVVDQDGDQTEGHFGEDLKDSEDKVVTAKDYMPGYVRAYTWDAIGNGYKVLAGDTGVKIGDGIWVYFPGAGIAP